MRVKLLCAFCCVFRWQPITDSFYPSGESGILRSVVGQLSERSDAGVSLRIKRMKRAIDKLIAAMLFKMPFLKVAAPVRGNSSNPAGSVKTLLG